MGVSRIRPASASPDQPLNAAARLSAARRRFHKTGYRLHRSRWHPDRYMIFDRERDVVAAGADFTLTLDDVEAWLRDHASDRDERG